MNYKSLMKLLSVLSLFVLISSCKKSSDDSTDSATQPAPGDCLVSPIKIGTSYTYGSYSYSFTKDTTINSKKYFKSNNSPATYLGVDASGNVWTFVPQQTFGDISAVEVIAVKPGQAVGTKWSYIFNSLAAPSVISYKYNYEVKANNITFTLNGKTYNNCTRVGLYVETRASGTVYSTTPTTYSTWGCGIGFTSTEDGSTTTLTNYTY